MKLWLDISAIWEGDFDRISKGEYGIERFVQAVDQYISTVSSISKNMEFQSQ
ncbi:hypothetical protein [Vibrio maritimus]|uniref:hypothetical protein n=1 Tax=Vibrio maritimus TaxID=990268 RepID=UPI001F42EDEB|nr:hypothetical protein [Vibrio maritimus]